MRFIKVFISIILTSVLISSCDRCGYLECAVNDISYKVRIVSATTGKDLVFGSTSVYNKNQIKFYTVKGTDTTYYSSYNNSQGQGLDSAIYVSFFPKSNIVYMRLSNGDVDTFSITYTTSESKCCGVFDNINTFNYNTINVPVREDLIELKK